MKFKYFKDRKGPIMRSKEICVDSTKVMELAFQNILNEIIEHVIEGVCFEAHRALKLGYFSVNEYIIKEHKLEIYSGEERPSPKPGVALFDNKKNNEQFSTCPYCNQLKAASNFIRHKNSCRSRTRVPVWIILVKQKIMRTMFRRKTTVMVKKGNDKKRAKSAPNYDTMTPEQKHDFLLTHCGVVSKHTRKPCCNSLICSKHSKEDKEKVRGFNFVGLPDHLVDCNIDLDTVD
ncbi:unnamed protein product [Larinioides sclopetarius]|uniref:SCA7 domain-containing protein n=1 Tax=Larinioides sclopetarius TaxID=280406 RepID=A0AAV1YV07_9ARAC